MLDTEFYPFKSLLAALLLLLPLTMLAQESGSSTVEADFLARGEPGPPRGQAPKAPGGNVGFARAEGPCLRQRARVSFSAQRQNCFRKAARSASQAGSFHMAWPQVGTQK